MPSHTWTDQLGRTYDYEPYDATPIADIEVRLSEASILAVAKASQAIGTAPAVSLAGTASVIFRSEASASSIIEDLTVGSRRILEAQVADPDERRDPIAERIVGNLEGLRDALETPYPARIDDILRWHRKLLEGHPRMRHLEVGRLRTAQNWIGGDGFGPRHAEFIPPPQDQVRALLHDLIRYLERTDVAPVVQALIAHARFEVIHPFTDGNGRVGRMLLQHALTHRAGIRTPIPVSVPWSRNKHDYIEGLRRFQNGNIDPWISFGATSLVAAVGWATSAQDRVATLLDHLRSRSTTRAGSAASRIVDDLAEHPLVDTTTVASRYGISRQAANEALRRLQSAGVLTERSFSRRAKGRPRTMFGSTELIDLLGAIVTE